MLKGKNPLNIQLTVSESLNTKTLLYNLMLRKINRKMGFKQVDIQ